MHFAPDTEDVLEFNVALVNTGAGASRSGDDELSTRAELTALLDSFAFSGRFDRDDAELASVQGVRAELRRIWTLERDLLASEVNRMLADSVSSPRLVRHDALDWHLHATSDDAPLADRIRVESALALVDVIRTDEVGRLRACAADDCDGVFVDLSRNGSKRFCGIRCGNRVNMIAFRERRADAD